MRKPFSILLALSLTLMVGACTGETVGTSTQGDLLIDEESTGYYVLNNVNTTELYVWGLPPLKAVAGRSGVLRAVRLIGHPDELTVVSYDRLNYAEFGRGIGLSRRPLKPAHGGRAITYPVAGMQIGEELSDFVIVTFRFKAVPTERSLNDFEISYSEGGRDFKQVIGAHLELRP